MCNTVFSFLYSRNELGPCLLGRALAFFVSKSIAGSVAVNLKSSLCPWSLILKEIRQYASIPSNSDDEFFVQMAQF